MKRTTRNAAKTKQEIIEKSASVFNIHGYAGTKMQMLIDATGYQMGGIYRHFDTKMDLAKAAFQYNCELLIQENLKVDDQEHPQKQLLTIINNYKKMVTHPIMPGGCPLLNTAIEVDDTDKAFKQLAQNFLAEVISILESILEEGKRRAVFKASIDPKKEAIYLLATVEGAIMVGKLTNSRRVIMNIFDQMIQYLEGNIFEK